jgi:ADP-ribosylglycohydrolase
VSDDSALPSGAEAATPRSDYARRVRGCLLGGALGDALGAPIEFLDLAAIRKRYGPRGLDYLAPGHGLDQRPGTITDDTQMTLFTAEGLIRAFVRGKSRGIGHPPAVVHHAYRRWLHTQGIPWIEAAQHPPGYVGPEPDGWLIRERFLFARRAPGHTCLGALEAPGALGQSATNDSKGCGGVMRAAPVGLLPHAGTGSEATSVEAVFRLAVETAALTHGHPTGQLAAGVLAATLHMIVFAARPLDPALDAATRILRRQPRHEETLAALEAARALAGRSGEPTPEHVESLGGGWIAEEALAIAVYAALVHRDDPRAALALAANHSGDSDSTAAICGNLLGALLGDGALPQDWLAELEGRPTIERLADDFAAEMTGTRPAEDSPEYAAWWERYPGW